MPRIRLGTIGFGYADWAGEFYPPGVRPGDYLSHYARHFDTVELDTTFHATPPIERVRRWFEATPEHFRFCVKAPKEVTHEGPIDRQLPAMEAFLDVMRGLGEKLAAILIQLPPSFGMDQFDAFERFLKKLPRDVRFAVEFRNGSWGQQRTLDLLREHGCALVAAEYLTRPSRVYVTTDFLYVRWIGEHQHFARLDREQVDVEASLRWWKGELERVMAGDSVKEIYGFFNNDYSGYAVATCRRFMRMMGLAVDPMAVQGELFGGPGAAASPRP